MAKKIELTNDEIDTLTRVLDSEIQEQKDFKNNHGHNKEFKAEIQETITMLKRLSTKLVRIYRQQNQGGK